MTRILFLGDLAATGFGTVTMDLGRAMLAAGDDLRFMSLNETPADDLEEPFGSRTFKLGEASGWIHMPKTPEEAVVVNARIEGMFAGETWPDGWRPEVAIILGDYTAVRLGTMPMVLRRITIPVLHYVPIEGVGLPPRWAEFWAKIRPVAMSEFGAAQIEEIMGKRPPMAYHGVDTEAFYPVSPERPIVVPLRGKYNRPVLRTLTSKADCKEFYGHDPKRTLLFRADRNMPRKRYGDLFAALAPILARNPGVDFMYHCRTFDQGGDLDDERSKYGPMIGTQEIEGKTFPLFGGVASRMFPARLQDVYNGIDRRALNIMYNAADIYVSNSSEGFGLTIAEAMACGVPAVGMGFSSVTEVIGGQLPDQWTEPFIEGAGGLIVKPGGLIANPHNHFWASVDIPSFGLAVEHLIQHRKRRVELGFLASKHIERSFQWSDAARIFHDLASERVAVAA